MLQRTLSVPRSWLGHIPLLLEIRRGKAVKLGAEPRIALLRPEPYAVSKLALPRVEAAQPHG